MLVCEWLICLLILISYFDCVALWLLLLGLVLIVWFACWLCFEFGCFNGVLICCFVFMFCIVCICLGLYFVRNCGFVLVVLLVFVMGLCVCFWIIFRLRVLLCLGLLYYEFLVWRLVCCFGCVVLVCFGFDWYCLLCWYSL